MYCGENILKNKGETSSNIECFKKGIKLGLEQTKDNHEIYIKNNSSNEKIYCGDDIKKISYDKNTRVGKRSECMRKGFGVGTKKNFVKNLLQLTKDIDILLCK